MRWARPLLVGALLACLTTVGVALGQQGKVVSSDHDLGVATGHSGVSTCEICHIPHDASGESIWAQGPHAQGATFSGIRPSCYSCHDGTVTVGGTYAFDEESAHHPIKPGQATEDCDMCHDPHEPEFGNYLLFPAGADFCKSCHTHASAEDHPVDIDTAEVGSAPLDDQWDPDKGDYSGARLWSSDGLRPGTCVKCLSCHAGHGTRQGATLLTMSIDESGTDSLCLNCHSPG